MSVTDCCEIDLRWGPVEPIQLAIDPQPIELRAAVVPIELEVEASPVEFTIAAQPIRLEITGVGVQGPPGPAGLGTGGSTAGLVQIRWGTPTAESGNVIEIAGSVLDYDSLPLASSVADIEVRVTDGAVDGEPSATAFLTAAGTPVGTVLAGSGTASLVIRSDSGSLAIAVHEATANCHRYLWIRAAGHERLWVRAADGVQEVIFA